MPRDCAPHALGEVRLPAGRTGRVVELVAAGQFCVEVCGADWIGRLAGAGALDRHEVAAAQTLAALFEQSGVRPRVAGGYSGKVDTGAVGHHALEDLDDGELRAWRRVGRLLAAAPVHCRAEVEAVVFWDRQPVDVQRLRVGLDAVARAIRAPRRRR